MGRLEQLFSGFVSELEAAGVRHAFLRGHMLYPSVRKASDVDMLAHPRDRARTEAIFRRVAEREGFHIWQRFRSGFITRLFSYAFDETGEHAFFDLDIHTSEASYGIPYASAESLLSFVDPQSSPRTLRPAISATVNGIGHLFMSGGVPEKYAAPWQVAARDADAGALVQAVLGARAADELTECLVKGSALPNGKVLGAAARRRMLKQHTWRSSMGWLRFVLGERAWPWLRPRGRFIIFSGTDGSGKTTLIGELLQVIAPQFRDGAVEQHHLRPGVIPQISALFHGGKPAYTIDDMDDPHRSTPSGFLGSSLRTAYYWIDYFIGYPLRILPRRRRNALILYDRWFYDHVVDPRRFRIAPGHPLPGLLARLLAKPDRDRKSVV